MASLKASVSLPRKRQNCFAWQTDSAALNSSRTYWRLAKWLTSITRACVPTPAPDPGTGAASSQGQPSWARAKGIPYDHAPVPVPRAQPPCSSLCNKPAVSISSLTHIHNLIAGGTADSHGSAKQPYSTSHCSPTGLLKWWSEMKRKKDDKFAMKLSQWLRYWKWKTIIRSLPPTTKCSPFANHIN